jgi:hypothetical protein
MSRFRFYFLAMAFCMTLAVNASPAAQQIERSQAVPSPERAERYLLIRKLVLAWGPYVEAIHQRRLAEWANETVPIFRAARTADLRQANTADTFGAMMRSLLGNGGAGATAKSYPQASQRLVFTPVQSCKMYDSRSGAMPPANIIVQLDVQGCDIPLSAEAVQFDVAAISPIQAGYFKIWPSDTDTWPTTSTISYSTGQNIQNELVSRISYDPFRKLKLYSTGRAHLVMTVTGYFTPKHYLEPQLNCQNFSVNGTIEAQPVAGERTLPLPTCPSSYNFAASSGCTLDPSRTFLGVSGNPASNWTCLYRNVDNAPSAGYTATTTCCTIQSDPPP